MKTLKVLLLFLAIPLFNYAQNCSANPGGDRSICKGDPMILFGEDSDFYLHPLVIEWTVVSSPIPVEFDDENILQPTVNPSAPATGFVNGNYEFQLQVTCADSNITFANVNVYVGEIVNPATILPPYDVNSSVCGSTVTIEGSQPDAGVNTLWLIKPDLSVNITPSPNGTSVEVTRQNGATYCDYTIYYYQNIGNCESVDSTEIHFTQEYSSLFIDYIEPNNCPSCSRRIYVCGTTPGCDGSPMWGVIDPPADVTIENDDKRCTWIQVADDGTYTFSYAIENGNCASTSTTSTCVISEANGFGLDGNSSSVVCEDVWDMASVDLAVNDMAGVVYQWSASSSMGSSWISFSDPTASATTVFFAGTPLALPNGLWIRIDVTATYNGCQDIQRFYYYANPTVSVDNENINLLCGGDPYFMIRDYINVGSSGGSLKAEVLASPSSLLPVGSTFSISSNTNLDLTEAGTYSFAITLTLSGTPPGSNTSISCTDESVLHVVVADIPSINAGSDILTCLLATQLNGNEPLDIDGHPVDIPVHWELLSGQTGVVITNSSDQNPFITGLEYGQTYCFEYSFSKDEDCMLIDTMYLTVRPKEECTICELTIEAKDCVDGCLSATVSGADTYLWFPADGVDDPSSASPNFCNTSGTYTVYGFVGGEACGFAQLEVPVCEDPIDCGGFYVDSYCTFCGCGKPVVGLRLYDSNDNLVDEDVIDITWTLYGNEVSNHNPYLTYYTDIALYSVHIEYTNLAGELCDTTITGVEACNGDCINFSVATCSDEPFASQYEGCNEYSNICSGNSFGGYIFILDDAGNLVSQNSYIFEINGENHSENPIMIYQGSDYSGCGPIPIHIYNWWNDCDTTIEYTLDCCVSAAPAVECSSKDLQTVTWPQLCGADHYEVERICLNGGWIFPYDYVYDINEDGLYSYTPDENEGCSFWLMRVRGYCSSTKSYGPWSECISVDRDHCFVWDDCEFWFGEDLGGDGGGRERSAEVFKNQKGFATSIHPNPVGEETVYINLGKAISQGQDQLELRIVDVNGRLISNELIQQPNGIHSVSVANLTSGLYFFNIYTPEGIFLEANRLVKQ